MSFCKNCGYMFISESDNMCGNCGTPRGQGNNFCSNCGAAVTPEQNNCTMCGYFVGKSTNNAYNNAGNGGNYANGASAQQTANMHQGAQTTTANPNPFQGTAFEQTFNPNAGYPANQPNYNPAPAGQKSKVLAGILGIFFGAFGVHNFYLGFTNRAVTQLILSIVGILTTCIGVGAVLYFGMMIWGLVEGIQILTGKIEFDADGIPLKND